MVSLKDMDIQAEQAGGTIPMQKALLEVVQYLADNGSLVPFETVDI